MSQASSHTANHVDVLIVGAGPAAALAASRLVLGGRSTMILGQPDTRFRVEGTSPRVRQLLQAEGVESHAFSVPCQRRVGWGELSTTPNVEFIVNRRQLDKELLQMACRNGAHHVATRVQRIDGKAVHTDAGVFTANHIVDARGRRATVAEGALRGPASIACAGYIPGCRGPEEGTAVMATPTGWCWIASLGDNGLWAQISLDASAVSRGKSCLTTAWSHFFQQAEWLDSPWQSLPAPEDMLVRASELRLSAPQLCPQRIRIGDAAVAVDPLSGHGLFWALSSALMLPLLLSALDDGQEALAKAFYHTRVTDTFWRQARIARDFYALCPLWAETPYWSARRSWPDAKPAHRVCETPAVQKKVIVCQGKLREADVLLTQQEPDGVAFFKQQPLAPVIKSLQRSPLPARDAFNSIVPTLSAAEAGTLHDWLVSRGVVQSGRLSTVPPMEINQ